MDQKHKILIAVIVGILLVTLIIIGVKKRSKNTPSEVVDDSVKEGYLGPIYPGYKNSNDYVTVMNEYGGGAPPPSSSAAASRFESLHKSLALPKAAKYITPYDVDIADPKFYNLSQAPPQVILKNRQYQSADPYRGDIPIANPNQGCIIQRSQHGREAQRYSATFNPGYDNMIKTYVSENESNPASYHVRTSRQGTSVQ